MTRVTRSANRPVRKPPLQERATPPPPLRPRRRTINHRTATNTKNRSMLTDEFRFLLPRHIELDLAAKLRALADDLERIRAGRGPSEADLAKAPLIVDWRPVISAAGLRLWGFVAGHPRLGNTGAMTSQLWAAGADGTWIRTLSRFYHVGLRLPEWDLHDGIWDFEGGL